MIRPRLRVRLCLRHCLCLNALYGTYLMGRVDFGMTLWCRVRRLPLGLVSGWWFQTESEHLGGLMGLLTRLIGHFRMRECWIVVPYSQTSIDDCLFP